MGIRIGIIWGHDYSNYLDKKKKNLFTRIYLVSTTIYLRNMTV